MQKGTNGYQKSTNKLTKGRLKCIKQKRFGVGGGGGGGGGGGVQACLASLGRHLVDCWCHVGAHWISKVPPKLFFRFGGN